MAGGSLPTVYSLTSLRRGLLAFFGGPQIGCNIVKEKRAKYAKG
jgi:hypothetical protein